MKIETKGNNIHTNDLMNKKSKKKNDNLSLIQWITICLYFVGYVATHACSAIVKTYKESSIKNKIRLIVCLFLPAGWVAFLIAKTCIGLILLKMIGTETKAVVIPIVTYTKIRSDPEYLYSFKYKGNEYTGNSLIDEEEEQRLGDTINIVFLDFWPSMNRPTYYFK